MKIFNFIGVSILFLLQVIFIIYRAVKYFLVEIILDFFSHESTLFASNESILQRILSLKKRPKSVAVVLACTEDDIRLTRVASILRWIASSEVRSISLYDSTGFFKTNSEDLHQLLSSELPVIQKLQSWTLRIRTTPAGEISESVTDQTHSNLPLSAMEASSVIHVDLQLLSSSDGKHSLALVANELLRRKLSSSGGEIVNSSEKEALIHSTDGNGYSQDAPGGIGSHGGDDRITEEKVDSTLRELGLYSDEPDLVLIIGDTYCLNGFPPWSIRLSETFFLGPLKSVTMKALFRGFCHFARTTQRMGK